MLTLRSHRHVYWLGISAGLSTQDAAEAADISALPGWQWLREAGGVVPQHLLKPPSGRYLSPMERATIMVADRQGQSIRAIAAMLGRAPSTISRELRRNRRHWMPRYHAGQAQLWAESRMKRLQRRKLAQNERLRNFVQSRLDRKWSPEQISGALTRAFPDDTSMRVSAETIYRTIYAQPRGTLVRTIKPACALGARYGNPVCRPR